MMGYIEPTHLSWMSLREALYNNKVAIALTDMTRNIAYHEGLNRNTYCNKSKDHYIVSEIRTVLNLFTVFETLKLYLEYATPFRPLVENLSRK